MKISYGPLKNARNIRIRGLSFDDASNFDFETALILKLIIASSTVKPDMSHWESSRNGCMFFVSQKPQLGFVSSAFAKQI